MKKNLFVALMIIISFTLLYFLCSLIFEESGYYKGQKSDHFDGKKFFNPSDPVSRQKSFLSYFKSKILYELKHGKTIWSDKELPVKQAIPESSVDNQTIVATYVGHSSFLLQLEGVNILTDPIWSNRASPFSFAGPKRIKQVGIKFDDLPKIDLVLISHSHYDHLDIPTIKLLKKKFNPKFFAGLGNCYYLNNIKNLELQCVEMDWNEKFYFEDKLIINFLRAKHWSKRSMFGSNATLWGAFAIESKLGAIYFAGDTGYDSHFLEANQNFGDFELALLPIGAYKPKDFMIKNHISPKQAVQAHLDLNSKKSIAMHYETFKLASENLRDPRQDLETAKKEFNLNEEFIALPVGESLVINKK